MMIQKWFDLYSFYSYDTRLPLSDVIPFQVEGMFNLGLLIELVQFAYCFHFVSQTNTIFSSILNFLYIVLLSLQGFMSQWFTICPKLIIFSYNKIEYWFNQLTYMMRCSANNVRRSNWKISKTKSHNRK